MTGPFPDMVEVPPGLAQTRLVWGLPPLAWLVLAVLTVLPIALLGLWWLTPITGALGAYLAYEARQDPDFLLVWIGELRLKARYH